MAGVQEKPLLGFSVCEEKGLKASGIQVQSTFSLIHYMHVSGGGEGGAVKLSLVLCIWLYVRGKERRGQGIS
jgi:hypothetical protein